MPFVYWCITPSRGKLVDCVGVYAKALSLQLKVNCGIAVCIGSIAAFNQDVCTGITSQDDREYD